MNGKKEQINTILHFTITLSVNEIVDVKEKNKFAEYAKKKYRFNIARNIILIRRCR